MFDNILERQQAFPDYNNKKNKEIENKPGNCVWRYSTKEKGCSRRKKRSLRRRTIEIFPKWLVNGFGQKIEIVIFFF